MNQLVAVTDTSNDVTNPANGFLQNVETAATVVTLEVTPDGRYFPAGLVTTGTPSITTFYGALPEEDAAGTETSLPVSNVQGSGTDAVVSVVFADVGGKFLPTSIVPTTAGSGYRVGDILKVTTAVGDLSFYLTDGDNATTAQIVLGQGSTTAFPVIDYKVIGTTDRKIAVYRSEPI